MAKIFVTALLLISGYANACAKATAKVEGRATGAKVNETGICEMLIDLTKVSRPRRCALRVTVGREVQVRTNFSEEECPKKTANVKGTLYNGGGGSYFFRGTIR